MEPASVLKQWGYRPESKVVVSEREMQRRAKLSALRKSQQLAKTHCPKGHAYTPENTVLLKRGSRACRECARQQRTRSYHKMNPQASYRIVP